MATCLNRELILFPSITRPGLFPPTGWENPATASPVIRHQWQWRWRRWWHQLQGKHFPLNSLLPVHDDIDINTTTMCKYLGQSSIDAPIRVVTSRGSELSHRSSRGADWSNSPVIVFTLSSSIVSYPWITLCSQWVYLSTIDGFNWYSNELISQRSMDHNEFNLSTIHHGLPAEWPRLIAVSFLSPVSIQIWNSPWLRQFGWLWRSWRWWWGLWRWWWGWWGLWCHSPWCLPASGP